MFKVALIAVIVVTACGAASTEGVASPQPPGSLGDTWAWDGTSWNQSGPTGPSPRYFSALAYDPGHKEFVLFGGQAAKGSSDETWLWDGKAWKMASPVHKPEPRRAASMAWDPASRRVVMYGGLVADPFEGHEVGETWTWDGSDWSEVDAGPGPPAGRQGASMVTTAAGVLLFGGNSGNDIYFDDTWQWHGGTWIQVDRAPRPPGRGGAAVAWDQSKSTMFVFGGVGLKTSAGPGALGTALSDAWSLSGEKWSQLGSGAGAVTFANALVNNGRFVVLLGAGCPSLSDIAWAWDGSSWARAGKPGIPARWGASLAVTPDGKALLFGGSNQPAC